MLNSPFNKILCMFLTLDSKSTDNVRVSGTDTENNDVCSCLTISDRSERSYTDDVYYDDVEERETRSSALLCSIKEEARNECDDINVSDGYLNHCVKTKQKVKSDCQPSSDFDEINFTTKT